MEDKRSESLALFDAEGERQVKTLLSEYELWSNYLPWWEKKIFRLFGWYYMIDRAWIILVIAVAMIVMSAVSYAYKISPVAGIILAGSGFLLGLIAVLELLRRR